MGQEEPKGVGSGTVPCSHGVVILLAHIFSHWHAWL